ncbi:MAG: rhomboid family intramembrane serine protease [Solirubrobacteraceae bacterium]
MTSTGRRDIHGFALLAGMVALMWVVEVVDLAAGDLDSAGIQPRDADGLAGIALAPFLHAGFGHLVANTVPFVVLGAVIALGGLGRVATVTAIVALVAGLGTWLVAPAHTVHIGASGVVFGYVAYLIVRGLYSRSALHLAAGAIVAVVWGGTALAGLLPEEGISWQGHLFGAVGGLLAARLLHRRADPTGHLVAR